MQAADGPWTFGIEEEFFIAQRRSAQIVRRAPAAFLRECRRALGDQVSRELLQSQLELVTPPCADDASLAAELRRLRATVSVIAAHHGLALLAAGTHPLAEWREQQHTDKPRYRQLMDDFQIIGRRNLMCGLHVHVAPPPGTDRVRLMNRVLPWLPLFLALSASSPFWNRQRTGLMSYRQAAYDEWPRTGIPDAFLDESDYAGFVAALQRTGCIADGGAIWWAIRPSRRYPTLELRICDACPRGEDALALAAAFRCLLRLLVRRPELGSARSSMTRLLIDENRWQAKRHGVRAEFVDVLEARDRAPAAQALAALRELCAEDAAHFGSADAFDHLERLITDGGSADRQLERYHAARERGASRTEACREVAQSLIAETAAV